MALHEFDNGVCVTCEDNGPLDEDSAALLQALNELDGPLGDVQRAAFDPSKHFRNPKGSPGGGRFRSNVDKLKDAIAGHKAGTYDGHPFENFNREQLRKVAKARGIELSRGESKESISAKLLGHLDEHGKTPSGPGEPAKKTPGLPSKPATKQQALDAAPVKLGTYGFDRGIEGDPTGSDALQHYRGHGYIEINAQLRDGRRLSADRDAEHAITAIDAVMAQSALTRDIQVHRGVGDLAMFGPAGRSSKSLVGLEFRDASYVSATADPNVANEFFGAEDLRGQGAILNIRVPAGTGAIQLSSLGPKPKHHWDYPRPPETEAELLLQRGLTYRVVGDRVVDGVRQLDVEVVPA